jgi:anti-sigma regulatory factor (Ser/Thr protein kinase)
MERERSHFRRQQVLRVDKETQEFPAVTGRARPMYMSATAGHLELTLAPDPASVGQARKAVANALPELGAEQNFTVRLLISELVTNALTHGDTVEPLELHASWNGTVRVEVIDHGDGFTPIPRTRPLEEPGGYGLFLVGSLADRWGVDTDDCTTVWFELNGT